MAVSRTLIAALSVALVVATGCQLPPDDATPVVKQKQAKAPTLPAPAAEQSQPAEAAQAQPQAKPAPPSRPSPKPPTPQPLMSAQSAAPATNPRVQPLIDSADKAYQTGVTNYRQGHLAAAKSSFDYAVDLMLSSGIDLKSDPQLSDEFDHIVDAINTLEMAALKQGNGFAPPTEPAPVDVANDVTFPVDPGVRAQAQAELKTTQSDLPLVLNDYVASYINFFANTTKGHNTIVHSLSRAGRYKAMIQRVLAQEGVPQDLIYQAVAESGFQPQAVNGRSGAGGMWQFMPWGSYGLARNGWYDERFDPEKSTRAYARYIKELYNQLGDWYLAMAAYDWGAGNIQRAVQRTGYADFWELYRRNNLPAETKNYVPIILAATIMAKNPKQYGLDTMVPDPPIVTDTVTTDYAVDLRLVADLTGKPLEDIIALNPSLLRMTTPPGDSFDLHLPAGTRDLFEKRIAEIPEDKRRYWRYHKVVPGDTVEELARTYHVSTSEIAFVNQLSSSSDISGEDALIIPVAPVATAARSARYHTRRGDTLVTVADRFGVTVDQLRRWNHLSGSQLPAGRVLYVSEPAHVSSSHARQSGGAARTSLSASHHAKADPPARGKTTAKGSDSARKSTTSGSHSSTQAASKSKKRGAAGK
jgi:membrane-bound lytic murein transglycosylase D